MTTLVTHPCTQSDRARSAIIDDRERGLVALEIGRRRRLGARLFARPLDVRIAAGHAPESDPRLAARAAYLVTRSHRAALAGRWERLAARTRSAARPTSGQDDAVAELLADVIGMLRSPGPLSAQCVASAGLLLGTAKVATRRTRDGGDFAAATVRMILRD